MERQIQHYPYRGTARTVEVMKQAALGSRGALSYQVRRVAEDAVRHVTPRDTLSQIAALTHWFERHYGFVPDPLRVELIRGPERILQEIRRTGRFVGDCDDASVALSALPQTIGIRTALIRMGWKDCPPGQLRGRYSHVTAAARDQWGRLVVTDPVAAGLTGQALRTARRIAVTPVDPPKEMIAMHGLRGLGEVANYSRLAEVLQSRNWAVRSARGSSARQRAVGSLTTTSREAGSAVERGFRQELGTRAEFDRLRQRLAETSAVMTQAARYMNEERPLTEVAQQLEVLNVNQSSSNRQSSSLNQQSQASRSTTRTTRSTRSTSTPAPPRSSSGGSGDALRRWLPVALAVTGGVLLLGGE